MQDDTVRACTAYQTTRSASLRVNCLVVLRWTLALFLASAAGCATVRAQETGGSSEVLRQQVMAEAASLMVRADELGQLLFARYSNQAVDTSKAARAALAAAMKAGGERCELSYRVVVVSGRDIDMPTQLVPLKAGNDLLAYVIGEASEDGQVVLGRHFRVDLGADSRTIHSVVASTDDCAIMTLSSLTGAAYVKEEISNGPTEFHVFLSRLHKARFRVRAAIGDFVIDNGKAELAAFNRTYRPKSSARVDCRLPNGTSFRTSESACRDAGGTVLD